MPGRRDWHLQEWSAAWSEVPGRWGILAEHDLTHRSFQNTVSGVQFGQRASYAQVFFYPREWFSISGIVERLAVDVPYAERLSAYKGELSMRLSSNFTIGLRAGVQRNAVTGALTPVASIQVAAKSVN